MTQTVAAAASPDARRPLKLTDIYQLNFSGLIFIILDSKKTPLCGAFLTLLFFLTAAAAARSAGATMKADRGLATASHPLFQGHTAFSASLHIFVGLLFLFLF